MKLGLDLKATLTQTLTPQQIQYLKLLQMSVVEMEQYIDQELEQNPLLENPESADDNPIDLLDGGIPDDEESYPPSFQSENFSSESIEKETYETFETDFEDDYHELRSQIDDDGDPFEFQKLLWQDDSSEVNEGVYNDEEDNIPFQIKDTTSFTEELTDQLTMLSLTEEEILIGKHIIGNLDEDGYLRRELQEIVNEVNSYIAEQNFNLQHQEYIKKNEKKDTKFVNPASQFALSDESKYHLEYATKLKDSKNISEVISSKSLNYNSKSLEGILRQVDLNQAEKVLSIIRHLDPPGIGSRTMQECLISQLEVILHPTPQQDIAMDILANSFDSFTKKHFDVLMNKYNLSKDDLKDILEIIKKLNPKPGGGEISLGLNTIIPDFTVERDEETNELIISLNDNKMPVVRVSRAYEIMKRNGKLKKFNKEAKEWIRQKNEDAKFIVQAIQQRKITMMKVMTTIASLQKDFFYDGISGLKPLIYKDVADITNIDISTVCRIVNNKYVLTEFGTYELKFFFSEALPSDDGEDVSTTVIKDILKEIIDSEPKNNPYSDEILSAMLKERNLNVARRTVAKYREQLRIPVARLRKEL